MQRLIRRSILVILGSLLAACDEPQDRHSVAPASVVPESVERGHVHAANTRVAAATRAELDTLLTLDGATLEPRLPAYLGRVSETVEALRGEVAYFKLTDDVWLALAESVRTDVTHLYASRGVERQRLLAAHGDRFRRLLDHTEELHDKK